MRIKLWGVRGSLPSPLTPTTVKSKIRTAFSLHGANTRVTDDFLESLPVEVGATYGGNTPCVEIITKRSQVIIDGGSGIRLLGYEMMSGPCGKGQGEVHLLFTHFHWDHLIGLPFFVPLFIPGNVIHVYAVQKELEEIFAVLFKKPFFPVPLDKLGAKIVYHQLVPRKRFEIEDIALTPYQLDHPDPCWGFRFEHGGKVFSHCVDTECKRVSREELGPDLPLYQGVDLMIFDAQYSLIETLEKVDWGHATAALGLDLAIREKVKKIVFMHHDPASSDEKISSAEVQARHYYRAQLKHAKRSKHQLHELEWCFATEGMVFDL